MLIRALRAMGFAADVSKVAGSFAKQISLAEDLSSGTKIISRSADEVNAIFVASGSYAPYTPGTIINEVLTTKPSTCVRVWTQGSNEATSCWLTTADEIAGLTPVQIQKKLGLKNIPTHICNVNVPNGTKLRIGNVGPAVGQPGGAIQVELLESIPSDLFVFPGRLISNP